CHAGLRGAYRHQEGLAGHARLADRRRDRALQPHRRDRDHEELGARGRLAALRSLPRRTTTDRGDRMATSHPWHRRPAPAAWRDTGIAELASAVRSAARVAAAVPGDLRRMTVDGAPRSRPGRNPSGSPAGRPDEPDSPQAPADAPDSSTGAAFGGREPLG